jgi:hypothetical protein
MEGETIQLRHTVCALSTTVNAGNATTSTREQKVMELLELILTGDKVRVHLLIIFQRKSRYRVREGETTGREEEQ